MSFNRRIPFCSHFVNGYKEWSNIFENTLIVKFGQTYRGQYQEVLRFLILGAYNGPLTK